VFPQGLCGDGSTTLPLLRAVFGGFGFGRQVAAELVQELLAAGLSRFEPDPINALARVERAARKKKAAPQADGAARARCVETQRVWSATH
jgi:hypothetical protein